MSKTNTTYAIDTGDGFQLCAGLPGHLVGREAGKRADQLGESVYLYAEGQGEDDVESVEVEPSEIEIDLDSVLGPRVLFGDHDHADVAAAVPKEWRIDWSSRVDISPGLPSRARYAAALFLRCQCGEWSGELCAAEADELVEVHYVPDYLRGTLEAAGTTGVYAGLYGSQRLSVTPECAVWMVQHDGEWCIEVGVDGEGEKREVVSWETVDDYKVARQSDDGIAIIEVAVRVGRAPSDRWYVSTDDDAGGSDDAPDDPHYSREAAVLAAMALARSREVES
jgi:hypothetical protein